MGTFRRQRVTESEELEPAARFNYTRDVLEPIAVAEPYRTAIASVDRHGIIDRRTFPEVAADANRWAAYLRGEGLAAGDRIVLRLPAGSAWGGLVLGAMKAGIVVVPCSPALPFADVGKRAGETQARLLMTEDLPAEKELDWLRAVRLADAQAAHARLGALQPAHETTGEDLAVIIYTAGTTSLPVGAAHTHGNVKATREHGAQWLDAGLGDVVWCTMDTGKPGAIWDMLGAWSTGSAIVLHAGPGDLEIEEQLQLVDKLGVTVLSETPSTYAALVELVGEQRVVMPRLRRAVSTGGPLSRELIESFRSAFDLTIRNAYLQAESLALTANLEGDESKDGSIGRPLYDAAIAVITEDGDECDVGTEGDLAVIGDPPSLFTGYWNNPDAMEASVRGFWFVTGDRARIDEDGYFWLVGRTLVSRDERKLQAAAATVAEAQAAAAARAKALAEAEAEERDWAETQARAAAEERARREAEARAVAEAEERRRAEAAARVREEAEARAREEEQARREAEERVRIAAEKAERREAEEREWEEAQARAEAEERARREAEALAAAEAEERERSEAEALAQAEEGARALEEERVRMEAEERVRAQAEEEARQAEEEAREAEEVRASEAAEQAQRDAAEQERREAEERARAEAAARAAAAAGARTAAEAKRHAEAERRAQARAEERARKQAEADAKTQAAAEAKAQKQAEAQARERAKAEAQARKEAEADAKAQADADARARAKAEAALAAAEAKARKEAEAEAKERAKAEAQARKEAEAQAKAQAEADARAQAREAAEAQARERAKAKERAKAEAQAHKETEAQARTEAEARKDDEARARRAGANGAKPATDTPAEQEEGPGVELYERLRAYGRSGEPPSK